MPAGHGANLDYQMLESLEMMFTPDILISPSQLNAFARAIDNNSVVCLNPGPLCRKNSVGMAALMSIGSPHMQGLQDNIANRLRIDFMQF